jgi:ParB-like chromosome segregation protein Spo0J
MATKKVKPAGPVEQHWPADKVERRPIESLIPYARNARTHTAEQVGQIAAAMREWGWTNPVLVDEGGRIIAGHGRVLAARKLGFTEIPVMVATGWTEEQKRAYVIADNKLALNAEWDTDLLAGEIRELSEAGFSLGLTGFDLAELGSLLSEDTDTGIVRQPVETGDVQDTFWISVRGPLEQQAQALQRLRALMADLPGVDVELGTVHVGGIL